MSGFNGHLIPNGFRQTFICFLLAFGSRLAVAQSAYSFCQPELIQYAKQTYRAYNQNWGVAQNRHTRFLYFANSKGLLEFDGSSWKVYELPRKQRVRSVAVDGQGRIYTGALGEFGYWFPNVEGKLAYHSLGSLIREKAFRNEEIWNILITPQGVLFQSFAFVYRYQQNKVQLIRPPATVLFVHQVRKQLLLEVLEKGLYELQGDQYKFVEGSEFLGRETVNTILPIGDHDILIGTERAIYRYDGKQFRPFNAHINDFMQRNRLNRGLLIGPDLYAFGTLLNGVLIATTDGKIRYHFNQKNGLQNSTVLSMCQDADHNLWVGLDKGIDLINLSSPIQYFIDHADDLGTVYDMARYGDNLYLGTNQGVYYKPLNQADEPFQLISGTQGQVWDLAVVDNQLLCGHNKGTFRIEGTKAQLLSDITGGWVLGRLKNYPNKLIQGTYTSLCIYQKDVRGKWIFSHKVAGFSAPVRQLDEDGDGNIWVNKAANQGLERLRLSTDLRRVERSKTYADAEFHSPVLNLCRVQNRIVVTSTKGLRVYDAQHDRFVPDQTAYPWAESSIRKIFPMPDSTLFLLRQDGSVSWTQPHEQVSSDIPVEANQWVEDFEKIVPLDTSYIALCRENGFALLPRTELNHLSDSAPKSVIRTVTSVEDPSISYTFQGTSTLPKLSFSHTQANLLISFCTPYYTQPVNYSYWLENSMKAWSPYTTSKQKEFNNLPPGQYVFHLKSNLNPKESLIMFEIRPPWYWNTWSRLLYILFLGCLFWLFYQLHLRRVAVQQNRIRENLEEKLRHQEEESQREIILLQKEQLEQGLIQKSEELANSTMALIQKNELLVQLREELNRVKVRSGSRLPGDDFQRINTLIDNNISSEQDWKLFESNFNKVHEQFLKHLLEKYPDLGQGDLKLAAYLRMNLSTKEIAQLLNITHRSVELKRYRLRKKLDLDAETNLSEFMIKY
ncbi:two-component regulator propeller domain-containing protein [Spirosoma arboris]|nr:two-component regulator propeller domain-containing protein [Spirosoma arboris]